MENKKSNLNNPTLEISNIPQVCNKKSTGSVEEKKSNIKCKKSVFKDKNKKSNIKCKKLVFEHKNIDSESEKLKVQSKQLSIKREKVNIENQNLSAEDKVLDFEDKKPNSLKNYFGSIIFFVLLICLTAFYILKIESPSKIVEVLSQVNYFYVSCAIIIMALYLACEAVGNKTIMRSLGKEVTFLKAWGYAFIGFYFSAITPSASGGQPAQVYYMSKDKIHVSYSSLTLLLLSVSYQTTVLIYSIILYLVRFSLFANDSRNLQVLILYGIVANVILIGAILFMVFSKKIVTRVIIFLVRVLTKFKIIKKPREAVRYVSKQIKEYQMGAEYIKKNPKLILKIILITFIQVNLYFSITYFIYRAFGLNQYSLFDMIALQGVLTLSVASLPLPGSVGASETIYMSMYKKIFSQEFLVPSMLMTRLVNFYLFFLLSSIVTFVVHFSHYRKPKTKG
ncbi:MAG: flippase-like domain-containing protein [Clostridioides sp.]|nr:flippase-like domain-containing protein [Clostridioides sp.]